MPPLTHIIRRFGVPGVFMDPVSTILFGPCPSDGRVFLMSSEGGFWIPDTPVEDDGIDVGD